VTQRVAAASSPAFRTILPRVRRPRHPLVRWYRRNERVVLSAMGLVVFFAAWQIGADLGVIDPYFFSSPLDILAAGAREVRLPRFWEDAKVSAIELGVGSLAAVLLAVPLGLAIGWYRRISLTFDPWLSFFNALPRVALVPLVVLWAGLGVEMKTVIVFLGGFFSIILPTVEGVRTVERSLLDVSRSFRARERLIFTSLVIPGTLPFIASGMRVAVGRVLAGVIIAEFYAQTSGIGVMIKRSSETEQPARMLFGVLIFTLLGLLLSEAVGSVERYLQRWRPSIDLEEAA
jgi:ABC-type nitrate/sulfonate/bicarbonate transport system permease component